MTCPRQGPLFRAAIAVLGGVLTSTRANAQRNDLIDAVRRNNLPSPKALLAAGAETNTRANSDGASPLASGARRGNGGD
jgi:hypothetical protein